MRKKFLREFRKELMNCKFLWPEDIHEIIAIASRTYKKCNKEFKELKQNKYNDKFLSKL